MSGKKDPKLKLIDYCRGLVQAFNFHERLDNELSVFEKLIHADLSALIAEIDGPVTRRQHLTDDPRGFPGDAEDGAK